MPGLRSKLLFTTCSLSSKVSVKVVVDVSVSELKRSSSRLALRSVAVLPSGIMASTLGLAATSASKCAARPTSVVRVQPNPAWDTLSDACSVLSSVKPGESRSEDASPTSSRILAAPLFFKDCVGHALAVCGLLY